ncbi:hypothetical protein ACOZDE_25385 [Streptomyces griseoincarnatus]|uniref:hypothetical protein n=1 Tax=Streptomyces sp. BSE7-9 TaxID=2759948 RepID=UPI001E2989D2|nr:hypothetical protein [Streptomyces sp. BSE7-9]
MVDLERIQAKTVAYFRALDEAATQRHHFRHVGEEGGLWYIEAVPDCGELVVIKQAELTSAGQLHCYSWGHLEDEHGFLTDQAIDPEEDPSSRTLVSGPPQPTKARHVGASVDRPGARVPRCTPTDLSHAIGAVEQSKPERPTRGGDSAHPFSKLSAWEAWVF